ncbi:MAG: hypothetical protein JXA15_14150 [Spirochaetales bacterium]|nr:hypothetical protein [Spirochaetales bacterium]
MATRKARRGKARGTGWRGPARAEEKTSGKPRALAFILLLAAGAALSLVLAGRGAPGERENRAAAPRPEPSVASWLSGGFSAAFEAWYADAFPFRAPLVAAGNAIERLHGLAGFGSAELVRSRGGETEDPGAPAGETLPPTEDPVELIETGKAFGDFLVLGDRAMELLRFRQGAVDVWADAVNAYSRRLDPAVKVRALVAPSSIAFLDDERYRSLSADQASGIRAAYAGLDPRVVRVDAHSAIGSHSREYLYFRTDHHWTGLGAFYAYRAWCAAANLTPLPLASFVVRDLPGFVGTLYGKTLNPRLKANPDTVRLYEPPFETSFEYLRHGGTRFESGRLVDAARGDDWNKYLAYFGDDWPLAVVRREGGDGRKLLVFKDSYGNALIPFLAAHFTEVHVIDPRHFQGDAVAYARTHEVDEVLFVNSFAVVSYYTGFAGNIARVTGAGGAAPASAAAPPAGAGSTLASEGEEATPSPASPDA